MFEPSGSSEERRGGQKRANDGSAIVEQGTFFLRVISINCFSFRHRQSGRSRAHNQKGTMRSKRAHESIEKRQPGNKGREVKEKKKMRSEDERESC